MHIWYNINCYIITKINKSLIPSQRFFSVSKLWPAQSQPKNVHTLFIWFLWRWNYPVISLDPTGIKFRNSTICLPKKSWKKLRNSKFFSTKLFFKNIIIQNSEILTIRFNRFNIVEYSGISSKIFLWKNCFGNSSITEIPNIEMQKYKTRKVKISGRLSFNMTNWF